MGDTSSHQDQLVTDHTKLLTDVSEVLERHGHYLPTDRKARVNAYAQSMVALAYLVAAYEGHAVAGSIGRQGRHAAVEALSEEDAGTVEMILNQLDGDRVAAQGVDWPRGRVQGPMP